MSNKPLQSPTDHFPAVRKAREALREKALKLLEGYIATIERAAASGEFEAALKGYQWLLDHVPGEDGKRILEASVDKPQQIEGQKGPLIQIGFSLGGMTAPKQLESPIMEAETIKESE